MIRDYLLPVLMERFPGRFVAGEPGVEPCVTFPAKHPDVGDVQIFDEGDEITLIVGKFTHGHFSNYDDIPVAEKERLITEGVVGFLEKLFSDQVVIWGSHEGIGGWRIIDAESRRNSSQRSGYVWSGPRHG